MEELKGFVESTVLSPPHRDGTGTDDAFQSPVFDYPFLLNFNASASLTRRRGPLYEINYGVILAAKDVANFLMCDPDFCPWIPFSSEEVFDLTQGLPLQKLLYYRFPLPDTPEDHKFYPAKYLETTPPGNTTPRIRFSEMISRGLMKFISYHEQAHFLWGHVHYAEKRIGVAQLEELGAARCGLGGLPSEETQRVNYFMEHHADSSAFQRMYTDCLQSKLPTGQRDDLHTFHDFVYAHTIGAQIAVGILELYERRLQNVYFPGLPTNYRTHPSARSRIMHCYQIYLDSIVLKMRPEDRHDANNAFLTNEGMISKALGIPEMSIEMVRDIVRDRQSSECVTSEGKELSAYRNEGHDLLEMFLKLSPFFG